MLLSLIFTSLSEAIRMISDITCVMSTYILYIEACTSQPA